MRASRSISAAIERLPISARPGARARHQNVFSDAGACALRAVLARRPFLAFDFDGTLAPIVSQPDLASAPVAVARRLARLTTLRPVAIITGRRVSDVRPRLGFTPQFVIGKHGAEWEQRGVFDVDPARLDPARTLLRTQAAELAALGVRVEDKGLSLALHYRVAPPHWFTVRVGAAGSAASFFIDTQAEVPLLQDMIDLLFAQPSRVSRGRARAESPAGGCD